MFKSLWSPNRNCVIIRSMLGSISICVLLHSCRGKMPIVMDMCYFSTFLSGFVSFHFVFSFLNTLVHSVSELTDTLQPNLQQRFLVVTKNSIWEKGEESCSFLTPVNLCLHCSQFGLKLGPCNGGGIGSLINGWMFESHLSSSLGVMECVTASCSSITCIMRRKRCVQLETPERVALGKGKPFKGKQFS